MNKSLNLYCGLVFSDEEAVSNCGDVIPAFCVENCDAEICC